MNEYFTKEQRKRICELVINPENTEAILGYGEWTYYKGLVNGVFGTLAGCITFGAISMICEIYKSRKKG